MEFLEDTSVFRVAAQLPEDLKGHARVKGIASLFYIRRERILLASD